MDYIFASQEIWTVGNDNDVHAVLSDAVKDYTVVPFDSVDGLKNGLADAKKIKPSLIVVDIDDLPESSLVSDLQSSGALGTSTPLAVVGSKDRMNGVRELFDLGIDGFFFKPLLLDDVQLRIELALRAPRNHVQYTLSFLRQFGAELTSTELKLLFSFLAREGRSISRKQVMESLWDGVVVHPKTLDVHLFNLRKKLASIGCQIVSGRGGTWTLKQANKGSEQL